MSAYCTLIGPTSPQFEEAAEGQASCGIFRTVSYLQLIDTTIGNRRKTKKCEFYVVRCRSPYHSRDQHLESASRQRHANYRSKSSEQPHRQK